MTRPPTAAEALYGHLPRAEPVERPQRNQSLGDAMWPSLKPPPPKPSAPQRQTHDEAWRDWSNVDPSFARLVGLVPKEGRR